MSRHRLSAPRFTTMAASPVRPKKAKALNCARPSEAVTNGSATPKASSNYLQRRQPMTLIPEWRKFWRMTSVQLAIAGAVLNAAAAGWSVFQGAVDPLVFAGVNMALSIGVAVARVVQQSKLRDPVDDPAQPK